MKAEKSSAIADLIDAATGKGDASRPKNKTASSKVGRPKKVSALSSSESHSQYSIHLSHEVSDELDTFLVKAKRKNPALNRSLVIEKALSAYLKQQKE